MNSFEAHDAQYKSPTAYEWHIEEYHRYDQEDLISRMGFRQIFDFARRVGISIHIDVGSGGGYIASKSSQFFERVIGVEPSASAVDIARKINALNENVDFKCADMQSFMDDFEGLVDKPVLITSSAVLSHIPDSEVNQFLDRLSSVLPVGSCLYFYEPYGIPEHRRLWYVRTKQWWVTNLRGLDLFFLDIADHGYTKGILCLKLPEMLPNRVYGSRLGRVLNLCFGKLNWLFHRVRGLLKH